MISVAFTTSDPDQTFILNPDLFSGLTKVLDWYIYFGLECTLPLPP